MGDEDSAPPPGASPEQKKQMAMRMKWYHWMYNSVFSLIWDGSSVTDRSRIHAYIEDHIDEF